MPHVLNSFPYFHVLLRLCSIRLKICQTYKKHVLPHSSKFVKHTKNMCFLTVQNLSKIHVDKPWHRRHAHSPPCQQIHTIQQQQNPMYSTCPAIISSVFNYYFFFFKRQVCLTGKKLTLKNCSDSLAAAEDENGRM